VRKQLTIKGIGIFNHFWIEQLKNNTVLHAKSLALKYFCRSN
jgi:hypothetical protein